MKKAVERTSGSNSLSLYISLYCTRMADDGFYIIHKNGMLFASNKVGETICENYQ
jgi:hypothetical protein